MKNPPSLPIRRVGNFPRAQITHEKLLFAMGEQVLFQTNHAPLLDIAEEALKRFPKTGAADTTPPLVLQLFVSEREGRPAPYPPLIVHSHAHLLYLNVGAENTIVSDLRAGYTFGYITRQMAKDTGFVRYTFIEAALQVMLGLARDFIPVHAACVIKDATPVLLSGPSGAGKSTLAYACLRRGYRLLAEDIVQVKVASEGLQLWGIPWKLHLLPESVQFFPELASLEATRQVNGEWKVEIDVAAPVPGCRSAQCRERCDRFFGGFKTGDTCRSPGCSRWRRLQSRFEVIWSWDIGWKDRFDRQLSALLTQGVLPAPGWSDTRPDGGRVRQSAAGLGGQPLIRSQTTGRRRGLESRPGHPASRSVCPHSWCAGYMKPAPRRFATFS